MTLWVAKNMRYVPAPLKCIAYHKQLGNIIIIIVIKKERPQQPAGSAAEWSL